MSASTKFRYALEPLLVSRKWALDALLLDLSLSNREIATSKEELQRLLDEGDRAAQDWVAHGGAGGYLSVGQFSVVTQYLGDVAKQRIAKGKLLEEQEQARRLLADRVIASQRALEAVEQHRDRHQAAFTNLRLADDLKNADDQWSILQTRKLENHDN